MTIVSTGIGWVVVMERKFSVTISTFWNLNSNNASVTSTINAMYKSFILHSPKRLARSPRSSRSLARDVRIHNVDRRASSIGCDLIEDVGELDLVFFARYVADVGRADDVVHREQGIARIQQRFGFVDVDRRHPGTSGPQCVHQDARRDESGAARIDQKRRWLHASEVVGAHDRSCGVDKTHVEGQNVAFVEK